MLLGTLQEYSDYNEGDMIYKVANDEFGVNFANTMRNQNIHQMKGALLVREDCDGEVNRLLEKIIVADKFVPGEKDIAEINWKPDPVIILVGTASAFLAKFEEACPGFTEFFGPVRDVGSM